MCCTPLSTYKGFAMRTYVYVSHNGIHIPKISVVTECGSSRETQQCGTSGCR